ncbi:hypothetical protein [Hahella ganghwensis]|uniref:hypothetical protein n=1 Tax=Hahella ganghwensis TaxID=286420 RepID=UPI0003786EEE|nr:hypothetical protein [Hahella ganghwensis]
MISISDTTLNLLHNRHNGVSGTANTDAVQTGAATDNANNAESSISTRAEKLAQLNKEFNITSSGFRVSQTFITRLTELGFLSSEEAEKLSGNLASSNPVEQTTQSVEELQESLQSLFDRLADEENSGLKTLIGSSMEILENLDNPNAQGSDLTESSIIAALDFHLNSSEISFSGKDRQTLEDLQTVLSITEKLGQENHSSSKVNQYLKIMNGF